MTDTVKKHWKIAAKKTRDLKDPWEDLGFENLAEMTVNRQVYNPTTKKWWKDEIMIKMEGKPFANGAMRECYRMKKLSKFSHQPDWENASNYVAKRYMQEQRRSVYEDDVQLQMDSKLWGEKYSKQNPPKKVDFCQAYLIEMTTNNMTVVYCVEHFIDGNYIKYNSNSGFVTDLNRLTPQAFSHFTFEDSNHQTIVVDIQGVDDLYTDPQMHTVDMSEYGEANLGTKGMALFFSSHLCSPLCATLGLTQFDLSSQEIERLKSQKWRVASSRTIVHKPAPKDDKTTSIPNPSVADESVESVSEAFNRIELTIDLSKEDNRVNGLIESPLVTPKELSLCHPARLHPLEENIQSQPNEMAASEPNPLLRRSSRSASVMKETGVLEDMMMVKQKLQTLGQVHYELCLYHILGRFTDMTSDLESAMFHLKKAGDCGVPKALYLLGCIHQQLPHSQLEQLTVEATPVNAFLGFTYLLKAAECGLRVAMVTVAEAFESGNNLAPPTGVDIPGYTGIKPRSRDYNTAVTWYQEALVTPPIPSHELDEFAPEHFDYSLLAKIAQLYETGGYGLDVDHQKAGDHYQQAGDSAMEAMKGKLASKYYMAAEESWALVE